MEEKDWLFAPCLLSANLFVELTCQSLATDPRPRTNDRKRLETNQFKPDTYSVINTSLRI